MLNKFKGGNSKEESQKRFARLSLKMIVGYINMIPKLNSNQQFGCFQVRPPTKSEEESEFRQTNDTHFISQSRHICTIPLVEKKTVTARWNIEVCIPQVDKNGGYFIQD